MLIYLDGKLVPKAEATVSVFDHGYLYGDGCFEGIRVYDGNIFRLQEHIDRLYESAKTLDMHLPLEPGREERHMHVSRGPPVERGEHTEAAPGPRAQVGVASEVELVPRYE